MIKYVLLFSIIFLLICIFFNYKNKKLNFQYTKNNLILSEILKVAYTSEIVEEAGLKIINILSSYFNFDYCTLFKYNQSRNSLDIISTTSSVSNINDLEDMVQQLYDSNKKKSDAYIETSNVPLQYKYTLKRNIKYLYFIPLKNNQLTVGALLIERIDPYVKEEKEFETTFFKIITETITLALQNLIYFEKITNSAYIDGLTQVYNRKYMDLCLQKKLDSYKKNNIPYKEVII